MKKIILDTNSLMAISEFKLDIFSEIEKTICFKYELAILSGTINELEKIYQEQRGKYKTAAKLAMALINSKNIMIYDSTGNVDDFLVKKSKQGYLILTQDAELKKRLTKPYLTIRQKKKVIIIK